MEEGGVTSTHIAATLGAAFATTGNRPIPRPFDRIVVFGDSLSDSGNAGRFSNGPVWVERLARYLGVELSPAARGGTNFAVGGAPVEGPPGSQSLREQVRRFLAQRSRAAGTDRTLYIVFGGANDIFAAMYGPAPLIAIERAAGTLGHL